MKVKRPIRKLIKRLIEMTNWLNAWEEGIFDQLGNKLDGSNTLIKIVFIQVLFYRQKKLLINQINLPLVRDPFLPKFSCLLFEVQTDDLNIGQIFYLIQF